jgi:hypothetical protein
VPLFIVLTKEEEMRCSRFAVVLSSTVLLLCSMASHASATLVTYDVDLQSPATGMSLDGTVLFDTSTNNLSSTDLTLYTPEDPSGDTPTFGQFGSSFNWVATPTTLTFDPIQFGGYLTGAEGQLFFSDTYGLVSLYSTNYNFNSPQAAGGVEFSDHRDGNLSFVNSSSVLFGTAPAVPEPGTFAVASLILPALGFWVWKKPQILPLA